MNSMSRGSEGRWRGGTLTVSGCQKTWVDLASGDGAPHFGVANIHPSHRPNEKRHFIISMEAQKLLVTFSTRFN